MNAHTVSAAEWSSAMDGFQRHGAIFARVGGRECDEWQVDALRVMRREAVDPRGWLCADEQWFAPEYPEEEFETALANNPAEAEAELPFFGVTLETFNWILETSRHGAELALKRICGKKGNPGIPLEVETTLRRFGESAKYFTNFTALNGPGPNYPHHGAYHTFSPYMMDVGVIIVTTAEVGVFWTFEED
jgi:hypothetical protein